MSFGTMKLEIGMQVEVTLKEPYEGEKSLWEKIILRIKKIFSPLIELFSRKKKPNDIPEPILLPSLENSFPNDYDFDDMEISPEDLSEFAPELFFSKILDIRDNHNTIVLYPPMAKLTTLALCEGDVVGIHYVVVHMGRYITDALIKSINENEITVSITGIEARIQEREFYRVEILEVVKAMILQVKQTEIQIYDISYTGAKIHVKKDDRIRIGDILLMQIPTQIDRFVSTEVIREAGTDIFGIRFTDLTREEKDKLEKYIKKEEMKKTGRGNNYNRYIR